MKHLLWRDLALGALVLAISAYAWNFSDLSVPNERTRAFLTIALYDQRTLAVDGPVKRFGDVYDLAAFGGHYFTDKAPGSSFLALPAYAALRLSQQPDQLTLDEIINAIRSYLMLGAGLLGFLALRWLLRRLVVSEPGVDLVSLSYALGSAALHYTTAFYGHVLVATCTLLSLLAWARAGALGVSASAPPRSSFGMAVLAGAAAGLAGLIEYQAVVLAALLSLPALRFGPRRAARSLAAFTLGALPFAALLLLYNKRAFGSPFELSYHHLVDPSLQALHGSGLAGATKPTLAAVHGLLFSAHRGLFMNSPLLGVGLLALLLPNPRMTPVLRAFLLLAATYFLAIVASSSVWYGGWSYGPRLLIPLLCALTLPVALLWQQQRARPLVTVPLASAALFGLVCNLLMQVTFSEPPPNMAQPLIESALPMLKAGLAAPNLGCKFAPLARGNLWPLVPLASCAALAIAASGRLFGSRALHAVGAAGLAAAALWAMLHASSAPAPQQSEGWLKYMHDLAARETRCKQVQPPPAPPKAPRIPRTSRPARPAPRRASSGADAATGRAGE